jgi:hypothetical protein
VHRAVYMIIGATALLFLAATALGVLAPVASYPLLSTIPAFTAVGTWGPKGVWAAAALIPAVFLLWSIHLFGGSSAIPFRSMLLLSVGVVVSIVYFAFSWSYALKYQGTSYTIAIAAINIAAIAFLISYGWTARRSPSFAKSYVFHLCLFAWLGAFAFPWLGEMP